MALGALRLLNGRSNGYFLMVEGGAVDWAMHANEIDRTVEEMTAFNATVEAVVAWIEAHGGFDRHLLVLTADHDHLLYGPEADKIPFQPVQDLGPGVIPAASFHSTGHSNHLVPVYARGVGAERLRTLADQRDPVHGPYIEDTEIFTLLMAALGKPAVPAITNR
jgi:alkaline phosphatase